MKAFAFFPAYSADLQAKLSNLQAIFDNLKSLFENLWVGDGFKDSRKK